MRSTSITALIFVMLFGQIQLQASCTYSLSSNEATHGPATVSGSFTVTADAGCSWSITVEGAISAGTGINGTAGPRYSAGTDTVYYGMGANYTGATRTAVINVYDGDGAPVGAYVVTQIRSGTLSKLHFFGIGVDWSPVGECIRGDLDANDIAFSLQSNLPNASTNMMVLPLNAASSGASNRAIILSAFAQFASAVGPDDTVVFYISTHGSEVVDGNGVGDTYLLIAKDETHPLTGESLAILLSTTYLPSSTRKIVILDACHGGGAAVKASRKVENTSVLSATLAFQETTGCRGVFTKGIINELNAKEFALPAIAEHVRAKSHGTNGWIFAGNVAVGDLVLNKDTGTSIFTGLDTGLYERADFNGDLLGPIPPTSQTSPPGSSYGCTNRLFSASWPHIPTGGSVVIQSSTDLAVWLQVGFSAAAGTNVSYTTSITNHAIQFFRAKVIP